MDVLSQIRNLTLGFAVAVLLPITVYWGVEVIIEKPQYPQAELKMTKEEDKEYESLKKNYFELIKRFERVYFYTATSVGVAAIFAGGLIKVPFLGMGLILGGTACLSYGYWSYWNMLDTLAKFISLLLALILIMALGYRIAARENLKSLRGNK